MNVSQRQRSPKEEFGHLGLGMRPATSDLGYDLVIENLDELDLASGAFSPASVGTGFDHSRRRTSSVLVNA
jgi:hypothetical protein